MFTLLEEGSGEEVADAALAVPHVPVDGRCKPTWKRKSKLPWREAGPPNHLDDQVDSDQ